MPNCTYSIRNKTLAQLKADASSVGIKGYSQMDRQRLGAALRKYHNGCGGATKTKRTTTKTKRTTTKRATTTKRTTAALARGSNQKRMPGVSFGACRTRAGCEWDGYDCRC
jgi:hypothetical protein